MPNNRVEVDHIGFRTVSEEDYKAVNGALNNVGLVGVEDDLPDHRRTFYDIGGGKRFEVQFRPDMPERRMPGVHLDVRAEQPMATLSALGDNAEDWGEGEVPRGGIKITPYFMVMARPLVVK
jgi:hypothetical protein